MDGNANTCVTLCKMDKLKEFKDLLCHLAFNGDPAKLF